MVLPRCNIAMLQLQSQLRCSDDTASGMWWWMNGNWRNLHRGIANGGPLPVTLTLTGHCLNAHAYIGWGICQDICWCTATLDVPGGPSCASDIRRLWLCRKSSCYRHSNTFVAWTASHPATGIARRRTVQLPSWRDSEGHSRGSEGS
eukprot:37083-Chlamydomonas_euryale.AAC.3